MPARSSEREQDRWGKAFVDAPIGERIVVIEHLLEPWRRGDWSAWREALPTALGELALWRSREKPPALKTLFSYSLAMPAPLRFADAQEHRIRSNASNDRCSRSRAGSLTTLRERFHDAHSLSRPHDQHAADRLTLSGFLPPIAWALAVAVFRVPSDLEQEWAGMLPPAMLEGTREAAERLCTRSRSA